MSENESGQQAWASDGEPLLTECTSRGTWDFGRALVFYIFLAGATIVVGLTLLMTVGFKLSALLSEIALYLALPFVLSRFLDTGWTSWIRWPRLSCGSWVSVLLALLGLGVLISNIPVAFDRIYPMSDEYKQFFETFLRADSTGEFVLLFIVAALVPGICEEITFRGLIQGGIRATYGPKAAVAITSVLFAVIHLSIWNFFALGVMGAFFGVLKEKTGSIWPGAVAHVVNNTIALALITAAPPTENSWHYDFFPLWMNLTALVVFAAGMVLFWRYQSGQAVQAAR